MPMLFVTKKKQKSRLINLAVKVLIEWEINVCHAVCTKITIKKKVNFLI